jgi:hypothetical protein
MHFTLFLFYTQISEAGDGRSRGGRGAERYEVKHIFEATFMRAQCESNMMPRTVRVATKNNGHFTSGRQIVFPEHSAAFPCTV